MATAPYQWLKQAERRGESIASERNATNDVYADYALSNQGRYMPWSGSVSSGNSPKFAKAYTYDELVLMGKGMFPKETLESLNQQYEKEKTQLFTSGSRAGQESGVARYINGDYQYTTPSQITLGKIKALESLNNPEYKSEVLNQHLSDLSTKDFDGRQGFIDRPSSQESNGGTLEINTNNETPEGDTVYGFNNLLQGFDQRAKNFAERTKDFTNSMIMFPNSRKFSPTQHYFIDKLKITNRN